GDPRNYKWLNTIPLTKIWEQMHLAHAYGADRIWIVNVGDLKPMEFPIEFFLNYAWRPEAITYEQLDVWSHAWAARQFGEARAAEIAALINGYTKLNHRRKPELLTPETFSIVNYREAERVVAEWRELELRAREVEKVLPAEAHAAFNQLVLHPIEACRVVNDLYVTVGRNRLYAVQGRASTNTLAQQARELFAADAALTARWDAMLDGKWRHMMDQTHLGYTYWQQPTTNAMPAVTEVHLSARGLLGLAVEGDPLARPGDYPIPAVAKLPSLTPLGPPSRWLDLFNRGATPVRFTIEASAPWIKLSTVNGELGADVRVEIAADWTAVPAGVHEAKLTIRSDGADAAPLVVIVPVDNQPVLGRGFVEVDGHIAIEAPHFQRAIAAAGVEWKTLNGFGRTAGGVTSFPVTAPRTPPTGNSARLEYDVVFRSTGEFKVELTCAPTFDFQPGERLELALSLDDQPPQIVPLALTATHQEWQRSVSDAVRKITTTLTVAQPGTHVLKIWRVTPAVVLQRIVLDTGGVRPSYLGPPESRVAK
ncbi:MAG TPA: glycosyl hydrolase 115 family protein, partial [Acidobacteriota bacterium]|nr:glycosyl hydrolase 115 family protein [Acidobacteriota bacterium]